MDMIIYGTSIPDLGLASLEKIKGSRLYNLIGKKGKKGRLYRNYYRFFLYMRNAYSISLKYVNDINALRELVDSNKGEEDAEVLYDEVLNFLIDNTKVNSIYTRDDDLLSNTAQVILGKIFREEYYKDYGLDVFNINFSAREMTQIRWIMATGNN